MNINTPPETHQLGITCFVQRLTKGEKDILGAQLSNPSSPMLLLVMGDCARIILSVKLEPKNKTPVTGQTETFHARCALFEF
jgi:hypothetical protein